ncbi:hypothetical protein N7510_011111 [Penicillium lagena]|uniref:uncharacterized protein n=1 Tax=Penicillium lagena TaxID=94218 RepID=UPI002540B81F|nr:uncharacterized protein N7510_011111 [Penicillium lagena]KAJ5601577.1 hypothetical protein N7510_011111 [Penicillium lagena]
MHFSSVLVPGLAALATAQTTTVVNIFEGKIQNPYYGDGLSVSVSTATNLAGSVVGINAEATTYHVECMSGAANLACSIDPYTLIAGPTTVDIQRTLPFELDGVTVSLTDGLACSFTRKTESAQCTIKATASYDGSSSATTITSSIATDQVTHFPLTVTGGLSLFNSPQATETPDAAAGPHHPLITAAPLGAAAALAAAALF